MMWKLKTLFCRHYNIKSAIKYFSIDFIYRTVNSVIKLEDIYNKQTKPIFLSYRY